MLPLRIWCWFALLLPLAGSTDTQPTFRTNAEYIVVDAQVLSGSRPVVDLKREDFVIYDNGQPQQITSFGLDDLELDVILLLDVSSSTVPIRDRIVFSAAEAM